MNQYLSYGAGVGSTALLCTMLDDIRCDAVEVVFCDHGADWPETYEYINYIQKLLDIKITTLNVKINDSKGLYNYFYNHNAIPLHQYRICTDKGKIRPFNNANNHILPSGRSLQSLYNQFKYQSKLDIY